MKRLLKVIAIFLSVLTLMGVFSVANPVLAAEYAETQETNEEIQTEAAEDAIQEIATEDESATEQEPTLLYEDESRRDEYTKHFVMSNGVTKAVMYPEPIHYEKNGKWQNIDNTLEYNETNKKFRNKSNRFSVELDKDLSSDKIITIENDGYTLSMKYKSGLLRSAFVNGHVEENDEPDNFIEKANYKTQSKFKYKKFEKDSDLEYIVTATGVKENIILYSSNAKNEYSFVVDASNLDLIKNSDGSISALNDENKEMFFIPAPFMYDSNNVYSYDVEYILSEKNNGKYEITVVADEDWLTDEERAYPVVIDPAINTKQEKSAIATTFVASGSGYASSNMNAMHDLYIGIESANYKKCRTLVKFALPELNKGDMVINARLAFYMYKSSFDSPEMPDKQINAHKIKTNWDAKKVTWNTQPTYETVVDDYNFITRNVNEWKYFDVTKTVKEWYEGESSNYGFLIKSQVEDGSNADVAARAVFRSDKYTSAEDYFPCIVIEYRNHKGIESHYSYSSYGIDTAGTASVNNYTGNLVYNLPILSGNGELMPLSLSAYYNTYCSKEKVPAGSSYQTTPGQGFRLNVQETVLPSTQYGLTGDSAENYPYVYTDNDGTEHYIKKVTENGKTTYEDEDNSGLKLTLDGNGYTYKLTAKDGSYRLFNAKGNLFRISDNNDNCITIHYRTDSISPLYKSRINHIIDGSGNRYDFTYYVVDGEETFYIKSIKDKFGRTVEFTVSGRLLRQIKYYDGTKTQIKYEFEDDFDTEIEQGLINYIQSNDGYRLNFDYNELSRGGRVKKIKEYGTGNAKGQIITFDRTKYNTTVIRSAGMDGIHAEEDEAYGDDDIITTMQFNDVGQAISQQLKYGSGIKIGAGAVEYASDSATAGLKNRVLSSSSVGRNVINLLKNGNAKSTDNWAQSQTSHDSFTTSKSASSAEAYMGKKSLLVSNTSAPGDANCNSYFRQTAGEISKNTKYTLSAYVKTENIKVKKATTASGAYIQINEYKSNGDTIKTIHSDVIDSATDTQINNGWRRISVTIETAADVDNLKVYLCLRNATGKVYFDCIQLEKSASANTYNMLENTSFENDKAENKTLTSWEYANGGSYSENSNGTVLDGVSGVRRIDGSQSFRVTGDALSAKGIKQTVAVAPNENDTYIISGWGAGFPVNSTVHKTDSGSDKALFEIAVRVKYSSYDKDGNLKSDSVTQYKDGAKFNTTITDWQYSCAAFSLKYTDGEDDVTYVPTEITIIPRFTYQANYVYFDNIMLAKEVSQTYTYDKKGNLISTADPEQQVNMDYDEDTDNLMSYTDTAGYKTHMQYDSKKNLIGTNTPNGVKTENTYSGGKVSSVEVHNGSLYANEGKEGYKSPTMGMKTTYEYYEDKDNVTPKSSAYLKIVEDQMGYKTTYGYDKYGNRTTVSNGEQNRITTTSTYNTLGTRLETVSSSNSKVSYNYVAGSNRLSSIVFGNTLAENPKQTETYSFEYDAFGNVKKTLVNNKVLSENTYAPYNGALLSTKYGYSDTDIKTDVATGAEINTGADTITYGYDNMGNRISLTQNNTKAFEWKYSASGTPLSHIDNVNKTKYNYSYDSLNRLIRQDFSDSTTGVSLGVTEYGYDKRGNLNKQTNKIGGRTYTQGYSYSTRSESTNSADYTKDNLPTLYIYSDNRNVVYEYDSLDRLNTRKLTTNSPIYFNYYYSYSNRDDGSHYYRSTQLRTEIIKDTSYRYSYDDIGNIAKVEKGVRENAGSSEEKCKDYTEYATYKYDDLSQLTRENRVIGEDGKTTLWTYDEQGNITSRSEYGLTDVKAPTNPNKTVTYNYGTDCDAGWNNLLTSISTTEYAYENDELKNSTTTQQTIDYDEIGNPITYLGANLGWFGRQLQTYKKGNLDISYTYDADGLRTSKTVDGATTTYQYVGDKLYYLCAKDATGADNYEMYFFYDSYGKLTVLKYFKHTGENPGEYTYYVATNYFGDVVALYAGDGSIRASYEYDAWGNLIAVYDKDGNLNEDLNSLAHRNPIRYRSYCYDQETGLYYLQSRYYNPEIGRFLNSDSISDSGAGVLGYNTFLYCANTPVNASDPSGHFVISAFVAGIVIGAVSSMAVETFSQLVENRGDVKSLNTGRILLSGVVGGLCGAITGGVGAGLSAVKCSGIVKAGIKIVTGGVVNMASDSINRLIDNEKVTTKSLCNSFLKGVTTSIVSEALSAVVVVANTRIFNSMSNGLKKITLKSYLPSNQVTTPFVRNCEYIGTVGFNNYIGRGSDGVGAVVGFGVELFMESSEKT